MFYFGCKMNLYIRIATAAPTWQPVKEALPEAGPLYVFDVGCLRYARRAGFSAQAVCHFYIVGGRK